MKRAYSPKEIQSMNIASLPFTDKWEIAFGTPGRTGVWIVWGDSGNGKRLLLCNLQSICVSFLTR